MNNDLHYQQIKPDQSISDFVENFWMLENMTDNDKELVILPDGKIDLLFTQSPTLPFSIKLLGLETYPEMAIMPARRLMFAVSFKLPAAEYIFSNPFSDLLNSGMLLPSDFWDCKAEDLQDFNLFCRKISLKIQSLIPTVVDPRKRRLFDLVYSSNGTLTIKELSEKVFWSSRQINRYFNQQYGISLKTYCNILRFRASFEDIKEGKLFPQQHFADQSHFIREVKKLAGVSPKTLNRNQNDRFIQFSTLHSK